MYVRTYVRMYALMHACMHACMYICIYIYMYTYLFMCVYIYILYICLQEGRKSSLRRPTIQAAAASAAEAPRRADKRCYIIVWYSIVCVIV